MTRSQQADLEAANRLSARLPEFQTLIGKLYANRFISALERDECFEMVKEIQEAIGRLALRASGGRATVGAGGETVRPSENGAPAAKEEAA
jgi:hypothetical protein